MKVKDIVDICNGCQWTICSPNTENRHGPKFDSVYESYRHYTPSIKDSILDLEVSEVECSTEYEYGTAYVRLTVYTK